MKLTKKQKEIYDFLVSYFQKHDFSPTVSEIQEHFGLKSPGSVDRYLRYLAELGYIKRSWNVRRGIEILRQPEKSKVIQLYGTVAAGKPIEVVEVQEQISVPESMVQGPDCFALRVMGDSMIDDGILDGDVILVHPQQHAENGSTVVALINNEATVKRFYHHEHYVELRPANKTMQPFFISDGDFKILGTVIGLVRIY